MNFVVRIFIKVKLAHCLSSSVWKLVADNLTLNAFHCALCTVHALGTTIVRSYMVTVAPHTVQIRPFHSADFTLKRNVPPGGSISANTNALNIPESHQYCCSGNDDCAKSVLDCHWQPFEGGDRTEVGQ